MPAVTGSALRADDAQDAATATLTCADICASARKTSPATTTFPGGWTSALGWSVAEWQLDPPFAVGGMTSRSRFTLAGLIASCATWFETMEDGYRSAGAIAARPPVPDDADAQTVLLARFGRHA